jgi:hypothetical protein
LVNLFKERTYNKILKLYLNFRQVPVVLKQEIFWNNVLNTRDVKQTMKNLDACVVAGTKMSPFTKRLERPYVGQ